MPATPFAHAFPRLTSLCARWSVTFLDLAANTPKISANITTSEDESNSEQENTLMVVDGGVGVVSSGTETVQEASTLCCIGGNFSLTFDGTFVLDVDLESGANASSAEYVTGGLGDAIGDGER